MILVFVLILGATIYQQDFLRTTFPQIVHHRYRRSDKSDPTSIETSKSAIDAHDDDVAAKSSLTDTEKPTIDSLLPEHEPMDTNGRYPKE